MNLIVMVDENWAIGNKGDQLIYIPADLKHFQSLTTGHSIIVGRKTLATFPKGNPLKNRRNLILSTKEGYTVEGAEVFSSIEDVLKVADEETFVVGGESIYRQLSPYCKKAYVTKVYKTYEADTFFPNLDEDENWTCSEEGETQDHEGISYRYCVYEKK